MKKINIFCSIVLIGLILFSQLMLAQSHPQIGNLKGINYQAVAIDENGKQIVGMDVKGKPLYDKTIGIRFSILKGNAGNVQYQETQTAQTDKYGLFSVIIGVGTQTGAGTYTNLLTIPWIDADQWLKVELSTKNDGNYKLVSMQQLMSVPYAFYTDDIADNAITTWKILDSTIINQDIKTSAVDSRTILDSTIINRDIKTSAVDSRTILDLTIINQDIKTSAVDSRTILDSTIINGDIKTSAVDSRTLLDSTIINRDIKTSAVDSRTLLDSTIINRDIKTSAVDSRTLLDSTIINQDIKTSAVDSRTLLDSTIINQDIKTGVVDARTILDGSIVNADITDGTIDLTKKVTGILPVANGGTGATTTTDGGMLIGGGTGPVRSLPAATDGQIPMGVTASDPVLKKLVAGTGIVVDIKVDSIIISSGVKGINSSIAGNVNVNNIPNGTTFVSPAIPLAGVDFGNIVIGSCNVDMKGCILSAFVANKNIIKVAIFNGTGANVNLGTVALSVLVVK